MKKQATATNPRALALRAEVVRVIQRGELELVRGGELVWPFDTRTHKDPDQG